MARRPGILTTAMPSVCLYFQIHQPRRLRRFTVFETEPWYFDDEANREILEKVAEKCYEPATEILLEQLRAHEGAFRVAFSLTGCVIEQLARFRPRVLELVAACLETGHAELLAETSHHSLAALYSPAELRAQVEAHRRIVGETFGLTPRVFRNTELIHDDAIAAQVAGWGQHAGILCEGVHQLLGWRSPNHVYQAAGSGMPLLLKNSRLSDDVAFRFSDRAWAQWPLSAERYASWIAALHDAELCNLFMDYETFGEHQWPETGIFDFLRALPRRLLETGAADFRTPSECLRAYRPVGEYSAPEPTSWADLERDLSAWIGNELQEDAMRELYALESPIKESGDPELLETWRDLTTSDHVYYMSTKYFADGDVHAYFNPFDSPYDAYIAFMNVLDHLRSRVS